MTIITETIIKGYELKASIGTGGFGEVFRAYQPAVGREVAIKVILPEFANLPEFIRRFETEAQLIARLEHPFIVPLFDYWREPGGAYIVLRYYPAGSLRDALKNRGALSLEKASRMLAQVTDALATAHKNNVVHLDIKPANLLLDEQDNIYLTDFGIARYLTAEETSDGDTDWTFTGSLGYAAPELIRRKKPTPRTDIYSLGYVLYEILTGSHPVSSGVASELLNHHLRESLPTLPNASERVNRVLQKATARQPEARYAGVTDLAADFEAAVSGKVSPLTIEAVNPYKGLRAFEEADAADFFGRDTLIHRLLAHLEESKFLAVVGPSGSGKSSVVKAGLLPALHRGALPGSEKFFFAVMSPSADPFQELATALLSVAVQQPTQPLGELLRSDTSGLQQALEMLLDPDQPLLLLIDQVEELFTMLDEETQRNLFIDNICNAVMAQNNLLYVILTLRADFYDKPLLHETLADLMRQHTEIVTPLTTTELEHVISKPAERVGVLVEPELAATMISDVQGEPGALPLLQYALREVFNARSGQRLTLTEYQRIGGISGALAQRAETLYSEFAPEQQQQMQQVFLRLIIPGEGTEDIRRRVTLGELNAIVSDLPLLRASLREFGKYRLLTFDNDPQMREPTVEIAHEALIREWGRLRDWIDRSRDDIRLQRMLSSAAHEWETAGRKPGFLLHGGRLVQFEEWQAGSSIRLTDSEAAYLQASIAERDRQAQAEAERQAREVALERQARRRLQGMVGFLLVAMVIGFIGVIAVSAQSQEARKERDRAQAAQEAAEENAQTAVAAVATVDRRAAEAESQVLADTAAQEGDRFLALSLAMEAVSIPDPPAPAQVIFAEEAYTSFRRVFTGHTKDRVWNAAFSPDGSLIASGGEDNTVILWDAKTGEFIRQLEGHKGAVWEVVFTPDGKQLLSASADFSLILWDVETGDLIRRFEGHEDEVRSIDINPDGTLALSGAQDSNMILWDIKTGELLHRFERDNDTIWTVKFLPDSRYAVSGAQDQTIILWDLETLEEVRRFKNVEGAVRDVAFSPDGTKLLASGASDRITMWNLQNGEVLAYFDGHTDWLWDADFSPDGTLVVSGAQDKEVIVWEAENQQILWRLRGHSSEVFSVAFSRDSKQIVSSGGDGRLFLWDAVPGNQVHRFIGHTGDVRSGSLDPSHETLYTSSGDRHIIQWNLITGELLREFPVYENSLWGMDISPDGQLIAAGSSSNKIPLWDTATGELLGNLEGHTGRVWDVAFSPDGRTLLSGSADGRLFLWDIVERRAIRSFVSHTDDVRAIDLSPDGRYALSGGEDDAMILWDVETGEVLHQFTEMNGNVLDVTFSPDGKYALSALEDNSIILWDIVTMQQVRRYEAHNEAVLSVAFSADGRTFASGSQDETVIVWNTESGDALRRFDGHSNWVRQVLYISERNQVISTGSDRWTLVWQIHDLPELIAWTYENRVVREFSCEERASFALRQRCDETQAVAFNPTRTPYELPASLILPTATPTSETLPPTATITPIVPTWTPTNTPTNTTTPDPAQAMGTPTPSVTPEPLIQSITPGEAVQGTFVEAPNHWTFDGVTGQVITIEMMADTDSGLDAYLELLDPSGRKIIEDDDSGMRADAVILDFVLPADGVYTIVARGYDIYVGGDYILLLTLEDE